MSLGLTLNDLDLIVTKTHDDNADVFQRLAHGEAQFDVLRGLKARFVQLKPTSASGTPLTPELTDADFHHDTHARAFWWISEAHLSLPDLPDAQRAALSAARTDLLPALSDLRRSYVDQATAAQRRLPLLPTHAPVLQSITLADGRTLYDVVAAYLNAGVRLAALLGLRSDAASASSVNGRELRRDTLDFFNALRESVALERRFNPALPADTEARLFGFFDARVAARR